MPDLVYSASESGGKSRAVAGVVYKETLSFQADTGNHNPRVGGSSPSSATIKTTENCDKSPVTKSGPQDGLHAAVNHRHRTCAMCRYLAECSRDTGAHPNDPICTAFASAATVPTTRLPGKQENHP